MVEQTEAVRRAEAQIRTLCGWWVAPTRTETFVLDGPGARLLVLPTLFLVSVDKITEDGETVPPEDYRWAPGGYVHRLQRRRWGCEPASIEVVATHGYENWPGELLAVIDAVAARTTEAGSPVLTQVGSVQYATDSSGVPLGGVLQPSEVVLCNRYRLPRRP